jgi:hypothetical protein
VRGPPANIAIAGRGLTTITINDHTAKLSIHRHIILIIVFGLSRG